jgi:DNA-binding MarR family transcriptional regulator
MPTGAETAAATSEKVHCPKGSLGYNPLVSQEISLDTQFDECLNAWGISLLHEWDLLVFLHRHRTTLTTVERISRLLGYSRALIAEALEKLERIGLVRRSRSSKEIRFYRLTVSVDSSRQVCFELLLKLMDVPIARGMRARKLAYVPLTGNTLRRTGLYLT